MCAETDTLVHEKISPGVTQFGEWNEFTIASLREMWTGSLSTAEMGRRLGFSKSAICGKAHRLDLEDRERIFIGNAAIDPALAEQIKGMHRDGKSIVRIHAELKGAICRQRIARVIGPQGKGWSKKIQSRTNAARHQAPRPLPVSVIPKRDTMFRVVNLHTLEFADETPRETYAATRRRVVAPLTPKTPRQCEAIDGPRFHTVQCEGIRNDLRSPYCPDCRAKFTRAA
jgi:GcrA cell cycle regulator